MSIISEYYDKESSVYSEKRYSGAPNTYIKFYFKNRMRVVLVLLSKIIKDKNNLSLLDIACADGVITEAIDRAFPNVFSKFVGTDISPLMVSTARDRFSKDHRYSFFVKDECPIEQFDIALGLGYISASIFDEEMAFLNLRLKTGGYYVCTLASPNSIYAKIKLSKEKYIGDYREYGVYRKMLLKHFDILDEIPSGIFIPKLWAFPALARVVQPYLEKVFKKISPNLFHERIYLLRKK
ncbi:MAG: methyltransferase [Nitrospira sp.]